MPLHTKESESGPFTPVPADSTQKQHSLSTQKWWPTLSRYGRMIAGQELADDLHAPTYYACTRKL